MKNLLLLGVLFLSFACSQESEEKSCEMKDGEKSCCHHKTEASGNSYIDSVRSEIMKLHDDVIMPKNGALTKLRADIESSQLGVEKKVVFNEQILSAQEQMNLWMQEMGENYDAKAEASDSSYFKSQLELANSIGDMYENALLIKDSIK